MSLTVKITVAEPSTIVRSGVVSVLRRLTTLHAEVSEVSDMEQLRAALGRQIPDILVVNPASLGGLAHQQLRRELSDRGMKWVALQVSLTDSALLRGYDEVVSLYDSAELIGDKLTRLIREPRAERRHESLSQREKEVIVCVIQGMTNKQIADRLCLSTHTVITHRRNISSKLQIHSTAGLTIYAIVNKLVELDQIRDSAAPGEE